MIILGIDPAITVTGWGVIKFTGNTLNYISSGVITTNSSDSMPLRLSIISNAIDEIIAKFQPNIAAMEEIFVNKNPLSSIKLSHARGAIMATIGRHNLDIHEFAPNTVKKTLTGVGHADKGQMLHMIKIILPTAKTTKADEADALAVAYTCSALVRF